MHYSWRGMTFVSRQILETGPVSPAIGLRGCVLVRTIQPLVSVGLTAVTLLISACLPLQSASNDNTVEWDGVYSDQSYRSPVFPAPGQAFAVELRVFRGDITSARVRTYDGAVGFQSMVWVRNSGSANQYDIWRATIPPSASTYLYYRFEITDGTDVDHYNRLGMTGSEPTHGDFLVNLTTLGAYPLGATPESGATVFRVWAPNATSVHVAGEFNGWSTSATPLTNVTGTWQGRVAGAGHGDEYKYYIQNNGSHWRTDPHGRRLTSSVGNSVVWAPSRYAWGDAGWVTPFFEDMILYELHVGTFSGEGDGASGHPSTFSDAVDRHLDHLVELGVNVVELMPLTEFAGDLSWGYNPASQYAIETAYGDPDELKRLVDRCHRAGIAVILDVVYNHMGASDLAGNVLDYDGGEIYFYPVGNGFRDTPWGPRPDFGIREVRDYLGQTVRYWLEEYHMDGFRLDGTAFVDVNTDGWRLLRDVKEITDTISQKAVVTAEHLPNNPAVTTSISSGGAGLDSQWNDAFHDSLRDALNAAGFGDPDMNRLASGMNHFAFGGVKAINYIESHDEVAVHGRAVEAADSSNPHSEWAYGRGKLAYGLVMFTAGMPMLLQGQEWMEDRRFGDATQHRIQWSYKQRYGDYFLACRDMTWLRRRAPALRADSSQNVFHVNDGANVVAWHRWRGSGEDLVIIASLNNNDLVNYCLGMPLNGPWIELLNTDAAVYGGRNHGNGGTVTAGGGPLHGLPFSTCLTIPRMGLVVLGRQPVDLAPDPDADNDGLPDVWERDHGLNPNDPLDAGRDPDGDGMSNQEEYQAGTDPHQSASRLRISNVRLNASGHIVLDWVSATDRTYRILVSPTIDPPTWAPLGTVPGTGLQVSFTDERPLTGAPWFYRVEARP